MAIFYLENKPHAKSRSGEHITTQNHFDYICREGRYETINRRHEELAYTRSGNMPDWANTPKDFWTQAEKHRRANGRAYREIKLGLQEELTLTENIQLVEQFCKKFGITTNHAFTYAIHDKPAAFDPSHRNIHVHIMFCEKIIEPNRPLPADTYFAQYRENRAGEPTSGYLNDAYFKSRDCTVEMRKAWARMVNQKFMEKGMDVRISEKTLKEQCDELKEQGRFEEAEYFDRTPAPHLGKSFRNPKKLEKMRTIQSEMDADSDVSPDEAVDEATEEDENTKKMQEASIEERKMLIFAADALIRRVAKELQEERQKLREEEQARAEAHSEETGMDAPMVITVADVAEVMMQRAEKAQQEVQYLDGLYRDMQKGIVKDAILWDMAKEEVVPGWRKEKVAYEKSQFVLNKLKAKAFSNNSAPTERTKYMEQYENALVIHNKQQNMLAIKEREAEEKKEQIQGRFNEMQGQRALLMKKAKDVYRRKMAASKEYVMYKEKAEDILKTLPRDQILYSEPLPQLVDKSLRINGYRPVGKLPKLTSKEGTFFILSDLRVMDKNSDFVYIATGIRDGNPVVQGKTSAYLLRVQYQDVKTKDGHTVRKPVILSAEESKDQKIRFYKEQNVERTSSGGGSVGPMQKRSVMLNRGGLVSDIAGKLAETNKTAPKGKFVTLDDPENKKDMPKTEYEKVQQELEQLGSRLSLKPKRFLNL